MGNFFRSGIEFAKLGKTFDYMNIIIQEIVSNLDNSYETQFDRDLEILAYMARRGIYNRIMKFDWRPDAKITVPSISKRSISITYAMGYTVGQLMPLAQRLGISDIVSDILDQGALYEVVENNVPRNIMKIIS